MIAEILETGPKDQDELLENDKLDTIGVLPEEIWHEARSWDDSLLFNFYR